MKGFGHVGRGELYNDMARLGAPRALLLGGGVEATTEPVLLRRRDEGRGQGVGHERFRRHSEPEVTARGRRGVHSVSGTVQCSFEVVGKQQK